MPALPHPLSAPPATPRPFEERLQRAQRTHQSLLCVGLDPQLELLPEELRRDSQPFLALTRRVVDATHDLVAAYKPQIAFFSALGKEDELAASISHIRARAPEALIILDAKRGDIGSTAEAYAREAFERYDADAVTVNPYMGEDAVLPFLARPERGAVLLCRTSNPGSRDFQDLLVEGRPLYRHIAERAARDWNRARNLMLVVGATYPREMRELRAAHPELCFLVPGIGAQGGDLEATLAAGLDTQGEGLLVSSSRAIIYAGGARSASIRAAALELKSAIDRGRAGHRRTA
jgi:orotidine-5'-phosphate decarboxylase